MRSATGGRRGLFEVPFRRSLGRNEFHSRADERLSAVEPKRLSRAEVVTLLRAAALKERETATSRSQTHRLNKGCDLAGETVFGIRAEYRPGKRFPYQQLIIISLIPHGSASLLDTLTCSAPVQ